MSHLPRLSFGAPFFCQFDKVSREISKNSQVSAVEKTNFSSTMTRARVFLLTSFASISAASLPPCQIVNLFFLITRREIPRLADPRTPRLQGGPATPGGLQHKRTPPYRDALYSNSNIIFYS
nr:MAG TPA: hypothetical protein [Caudoviricetes sp.]